jgi:tetratricopeptide (TPR) repeat protein
MTETDTKVPNNKETDATIKKLSDKINKDPKNAENYFKRAQQYFKKEDYESCYHDAKHAVELNEKLIEASVLGGQAATKLGKFQEAHNIYSVGLKQNADDESLVDGLKKLKNAIIAEYDADDTSDQGYNAVELCSQSPYPGDDELLNLEKEILDKRHEIREVSRMPKKEIENDLRQRAVQAAMAGHKCMMAGKFSDALESFTYAVNIETDNIILRRLRAEVYFINQDPISAMKDLMHIQKPERTADAWKLGGKQTILHINIQTVSTITFYLGVRMASLKRVRVRVMVFNSTFNNITVILWRSVLFVGKSEYPEKTTDLPEVNHKLYHIKCFESISPLAEFELTTLVVRDTDCTGSCKSN